MDEKKVRFYVYASHFLSAWGDRMWQFGVGMFMVIIAPDSLRLTAIYGLSMGTAILLFGAHVGNMVDKIARLTAARLTLIIQNLSVCLCAAIIYFVIIYKPEITAYWPGEGLLILCYAGIIIVAIVSSLSSTGNTIAVERDWVAEICGNDQDKLASMTATMKGIDLTTNIIAPIATGQIMAYASVEIGALFIGGWNLVSVFVEYYLLWKVYSTVPALRAKKNQKRVDDADENSGLIPTKQDDDQYHHLSFSQSQKFNDRLSETYDRHKGDENSSENGSCLSCSVLLSGFTILVRGWKTYMSYDVAFAGIALSCLYMTVLGFDNITVGYAYTQGVNESIMGILMAAGAGVGIIGTIFYPRMRKWVGLVRTGLFGLFLQITISLLCVVSIWAPGSPFDPFFKNKAQSEGTNLSLVNISTVIERDNMSHTLTPSVFSNSTSTGSDETGSNSMTSIILMLTGIVGARCGLWISDLTITQLFLGSVHEKERGVVLGVQTSLNQLMDMLKFIMVIIAPEPEVFGILVLVSFGFLCCGWLSYAKYSRSVRGHLFHFNKLLTCGLDNVNKEVYEPIPNFHFSKSDTDIKQTFT